jgi:muconolactone D-isomerase
MNRIQVILTLDMESIPDNFQDIIKHEQEIIARWKHEGILEHFFLREERNGAIFIFMGLNEDQVKANMQCLPLYEFKKSLDYLCLIQQF